MATCGACAADLPGGARFCLECGTQVAVRACPSCGTPAERGRFCGECGTPLDAADARPAAADVPVQRPVAERRVTSVLFGDLVGFTPLSESRDAEEVRELLSTYFDQCRVVIGRYGGVVEKFIGDAVMAVWGVPVAHEDDAERAVRAGLELVAATSALADEVGAPGLTMRVGVVTGEVAVTVGATAEGMVAGDAVNTASRVQSAASPGRVWVDEATRSLSAAAITFTDTGEHPLKGKAEPMRLWEAGVVVADVGGGQRVDGLEAPLSGRGSELRVVKELFHATADSGRPRLVVLDGAAGVGKSRMAWEFEKYVDGLTVSTRWHRSRCLSYGDGIAFWALSEAVRTRIGVVASDSSDVVIEHLDEGLLTYVADPDEREWLRPRLAVLLGVESDDSFVREDMFAAWTAFLEHLSDDERTVVLVIDDAQHADDGLLDFLDHLLSTARVPVFVLLAARPELLQRRPDLGGRRTTVVRLEPLDDQGMAQLVDGLVVGLTGHARAALVDRAEGIPLFAVETVRALIDQDLVIARGGQYVPADGADLDLAAVGAPASLQALVAARLDALTTEEKQVVTAASVLGTSFERDGLVALGCDLETLDDVLTSLVRKEILAVQSDRFSAERGQHRFVQSVVRQVAYATQSRRDRKGRHLAAAGHLEADADPADELSVLIASHLLDAVDAGQAGDTDGPELTARACGHLERAAKRARSLGAPAEALNLLEAALDRTTDRAERARLQLAAAPAAQDAARYAEARRHATEAAAAFDELGRPVDAALAVAALATSLSTTGELTAAVDAAEARYHAIRDLPGADRARLALTNALSRATTRLTAWDVQARWTEQALLLGEALDDRDAVANALIQAGLRYSTIGAPAAAKAAQEAAGRIARDHDLWSALGRALVNLASQQNSRDLALALASSAEAIEVGRRSGQQFMREFAMLNQAIGLWQAGRYGEVGPLTSTVWEQTVDPASMGVLRTLDCWLADAQGRSPDDVPDVDAPLPDDADRAWLVTGDVARARATGDDTASAALAAQAMEHLVTAVGIEDDFGVLWPSLVQAALAADDIDLAERLLEPVATAPSGLVSPGVGAQWLRLRGLVAAARGADPADVEADLRAGIDALAAYGAVGEVARAQEELARWLVDQGRLDDAAPLLVAARTTYAEIGATGWLAKLAAWESGRVAQPSA